MRRCGEAEYLHSSAVDAVQHYKASCASRSLCSTVLCSGVPEPDVTVCKDGTPVQVDGDRVTLSHVDRQVTLQVRETTAADAGEYTVTAVNERGRLHHAVTVDVIPAALECVRPQPHSTRPVSP